MKTNRILKISAFVLAVLFMLKSVPAFAVRANTTLETQMLYRLNELRLSEGLYPVSSISALEEAAGERAEELIKNYDHVRPDGSMWHSILNEYSIDYHTAAENIAAGFPTPEDVMDIWENSREHRASMLDGSLSHAGVGHRHIDDEYGHYWVQLFVGGCSVKSIRVEAVNANIKYAVGTTIAEIADSMKYRVVGECSESSHGEFSLPLNAAMCTGYNSTLLGEQEITVMCYGRTARLKIELTEGDPYIMGDVNSNGIVDVGDATLVLRYTVGIIDEMGLNTDVADMNGNGIIDTGDATVIMRIVVS